ncbi:MAG: signal recognition particle protein Srp54, partial [Desulfurococcales archaeon]|nr:signal recognition particle protein Srp54 [Desulfurococcales archaeon]
GFTRRIRERALREEPPPGAGRREWLVKIVYEEMVKLFGGEAEPQVDPPRTPWTIMLVGIQGTGKTTTAGKLALFYSRRGYSVGLVCADTYRPGAFEQLKTLAKTVGAMFYGEEGARDPVLVAARGVKSLSEKGAQVIIVDTAGRHGYGREEALLREMREIASKIKPDEVALVIDASIGQKAHDLASRFKESTPIGSIIVTKLDGTARGGGVLSAVAATGATVKFVGTGEKLEELEVFRPKRFVARILGMGDIESLIERMRTLEEATRLERDVEEMVKGRINLRLVYRQLNAMRKMGPLSKVLQMLPGFSLVQELSQERMKLGEEKIRRWLAIMESMTYEELDNPEIIDRSRMRRIAQGAGARVEEVRELLAYYKSMKNLMKRLRRDKRILRRLGLEV